MDILLYATYYIITYSEFSTRNQVNVPLLKYLMYIACIMDREKYRVWPDDQNGIFNQDMERLLRYNEIETEGEKAE